MAGLREKKKLRTQNDILDAAVRLFAEKSYDGATIEDIAGLAEVGVGTVYNYFSSKRGLLLALMARKTEHVIELGSEIVENPEGPPEEVICTLLWTYTENMIKAFDKKLIRELMVAAFSEPDSMGRELSKFDYMLIGQVGSLVGKYQDLEILRKDLPQEKVSLIVYSIWGTIMMIYIEGFIESGKLKEEIYSSINLVFQPWKVEEQEQ
ncbi:TetR/AcrR family transcriptional regulator [bacterium]|nr:TetR/AcrR family transcriptional regulator [bacterium]